MPKKIAPQIFETSLGELEQIVKRLEAGDLPLSESLEAFEKGVALSKACQQLLDAAELRIQTLTADGSTIVQNDNALSDSE